MEETLVCFEKQCYLLLQKTSKDRILSLNFSKNSGELGIIRLHNVPPEKVCISTKKKKPFCFEIGTPHRTYYLCPENEKERDDWIDIIKASISGKLGKEDSQKKIGVDDFILMNVIGKGSFGKVNLIILLT